MSFMGEQAAQEGDLGELTERTISLVEQLASLRYECASCWNVVKHDVAIFTCKVCFCIFHLYCMKKWARQAESGEGTSFRCPHCQTQHDGPLKYFCFCGKLRDPPHDPQITPHSCGQPCEKPRGHGCPHLCSLRCHPGPCPPCAAPPERKLCGCGATAYVLRCGEPDSNKTCGGICAKTLSCGKHTCKSICHRGQCAECSWRVTTTCYCGAVEEERACGSKGFSCGRMCGERLECGAHFCTAACHAGPCNACERDPVVVTTCPCGATTLSATRLKCTDPIPTCGKVCARPLDCGQHTCEMLCHEGPCKPCNRRVSTRCVCKLTQATVPCAERDKYRCAKICKTKFSCGKHDCRARCCPYRNDSEASAHRCKKVCNRKLPCGHHCLEECHRGLCPACPHVVAERLQCRCGAEVLMPPQPCGTGPPVCSRPCAATRPCKHTVAEHNCHYGDCPPCMYPVRRVCAGGHTEVENVPCSADFVTCASRCNRPLPCEHKCSRQCHSGECTGAGHTCKELCGKVHEACGHMCKSRCHAPGGCPACTAVLERRCECGRNVERRPCKMASSALRGSLDSEWKVACTADCLHAQRLEILSGLVPAPAQSHPVKYSFFLWDAALTSSANVQAIERQLVDFVQSGTTFKALPPMPAEKRALVHALSHYFHIKSESVDGGALRSCLLRRTPNTRIPEPRLTVATSDPQRHSPQDFTNEIRARDYMMQKQVIVASGCGVTVIAVQHALQEFAGEFVCEEECRNEDTDGDIRVFFTTPKKRAQALTHLRNITPPFRFSCPPSNKKDACSTSWASAVSSKTAKLPFRLDKWR